MAMSPQRHRSRTVHVGNAIKGKGFIQLIVTLSTGPRREARSACRLRLSSSTNIGRSVRSPTRQQTDSLNNLIAYRSVSRSRASHHGAQTAAEPMDGFRTESCGSAGSFRRLKHGCGQRRIGEAGRTSGSISRCGSISVIVLVPCRRAHCACETAPAPARIGSAKSGATRKEVSDGFGADYPLC
jgi:hypothetical protein